MADQLFEAAILLAVGMSVVFVFLTLLIGGIHAVAWLSELIPQSQNENKYAKPGYNQNSKNTSTPTAVDPNVVAAITAAVHAHRRNGN